MRPSCLTYLLALLTLILFFPDPCLSQSDSQIVKRTGHFVAPSFEVGGNTLGVSFSAEYQYFTQESPLGLYLRGGLGGDWIGSNVQFAESGVLLGRTRRFLDLAYGYSHFGFDDAHFLRLGYRSIGKKHFLFKYAVQYVISYDGDNMFYVGISVGYTFGIGK